MPKLFGIDIASLVSKSIASAGGIRPGVLTKTVVGARDPAALSAGAVITETTFNFQGFKETKIGYTTDRRDGQLVSMATGVIGILGASISAVPEVNDSVTLDGETYILLELIELDPAEALYQFRVE